MDIFFELGDSQKPKGHALVYFRVNTEPDKVYASYVITLPINADLTKYVPPFLASHLGGLPLNEFSAFAMPPVPEPVSGQAELERLARLRDDDLLYGGDMFSFDLPRMMETVTEVVQQYSDLCGARFKPAESASSPDTAGAGATAVLGDGPETDDSASYNVNEVLFSLMSETDKLADLARLMGKLRFAVEGRDSGQAEETSEEIAVLAKHLPDNFQVASLLSAARDTSPKSSRLAQLYLDRCFRLSAGDHSSVQTLESEIRSLRAQD